jgi:hypothetical protein
LRRSQIAKPTAQRIVDKLLEPDVALAVQTGELGDEP